MKKINLFIGASIALMAISTLCAVAEKTDTTYWKQKGTVALNGSQVSFSNWAGGGDGSVSLDGLFNYGADYEKEKNLWQNRIELAYGLNYTSADGTRKTNDKIFLSSTYGYKIAKSWYFSVFMDFMTQFSKGYDYGASPKTFKSTFMSPGYLSFGPGFTWRPKTWFTMTISPTSWRGTFVVNEVLSDQGNFGVKVGKNHRSEFGATVNMELSYEIIKNMTLTTRLNLYSNYLDAPQNVDVRWDVMLNMRINKWFSTNFSFNMVYDDNTKIADKNGRKRSTLQIKETLGVGLQFMF